ncbi:melanoma-associated antigen B16-like [Suncus etruscus]|uniref:melanoma-associated antigen B16-like n=1 Tax=Suncus etruscus TaxID=109475 RepID=UPI002110D553|nr:melanoma-associated antigen B16-like [Suncus etruscus]
MPCKKNNPRRSNRQRFQAVSKAEDSELENLSNLWVMYLCHLLEKSFLSHNPVMPEKKEEAAGAGPSSTSEGAQSLCSSAASGITTTPSGQDEGSESQEMSNNPSASQAGAEAAKMPVGGTDPKVGSLVNFMITKYRLKELLTREDMLKLIIKEREEHFTEVFLKACQCVELVFGLDVKEVDPDDHCYILLPKVGLTYDGLRSGAEGVPKTGVLILVLGVIFMKGNCATEEEVWEVLDMLGIHSTEDCVVFGDVRKLVTRDFVREKYLVHRQVTDSDPEQFQFFWGPRAHAETSKMKVLECIAKVLDTDPSSFESQYEEALQDEAKKAKSKNGACAD